MKISTLPIGVGWLSAVCILLLGSFLTWCGLVLIGYIADKHGGRQTSFGAVTQETYPWLVLITDFLAFLPFFLICTMFMTVAMQVLPDVVRTVTGDHEDEDSFYVQKWFWLLICWAIGAGLSLLKSTYYLGHISVVAVGVVGYTVFVVFAYCVGIFDPCEGIPAEECYTEPKMFDGGFFDFMKAFPVFVLSFCCAPTMFNIYNALETQSKHNMTLSSAIAMCVCSVLYATISLCGYFTYGTHVAENILDSYPISVVASLARFGMAFVVTVSYPLLMHSSRDGFLHGISTLVKYTGKVDLANDIADNTTKTGNIVFYIFAVLLNLLVLVIAYLELSLNSLMSVSGALSSNLSFTLPAVLYYKAYEEDGWTWMRIVCIPFAVFGIVVTGISLWANIA